MITIRSFEDKEYESRSNVFFLIAALMALSVAKEKRFALGKRHLIICLTLGIVATLISLTYVEVRYSGTILQEIRGYPRSFYYMKQASPDAIATPGNFFHWRFFVENVVIYSSIFILILSVVQWLAVKKSEYRQ